MNEMTQAEREEFIARRVKAILESHEELYKSLDAMAPSERDTYVHKRVEFDLLVSENIKSKLSDLMEDHQSAYMHIIILDAVTVCVTVALAIEVWNDVASMALVVPTLLMMVIAFSISRFLNYQMNRKLKAIVNLMETHIGREQQTSALDYLVDLVEHDLAEKDK